MAWWWITPARRTARIGARTPRTLRSHDRFRRLLVRWEKKISNYEAMVQLASIFIIFRLTVLST